MVAVTTRSRRRARDDVAARARSSEFSEGGKEGRKIFEERKKERRLGGGVRQGRQTNRQTEANEVFSGIYFTHIRFVQ